MALALTSLFPHSVLPLRRTTILRGRLSSHLSINAFSRPGIHQTPLPSDDDPPEAAEDSSHGFSRFDQFKLQVERARRKQEAELARDAALFSSSDSPSGDSPTLADDDIFADIDRAIAAARQSPPLSPPPSQAVVDEELSPEEALDLDEIQDFQGQSSADKFNADDGGAINYSDEALEISSNFATERFDYDFDEIQKSPARIVEPKFKMSLAELLDESPVVPVSVYGDLEVLISGVQHDSRMVTAGDLFVCCNGVENLTEADKRGAVAVVADKEINIDETLGCKALVIVDNVMDLLPVIAACFYKRPSERMAVIGVTGTDGVTTTAFLNKAVYEAMGLRTGMTGVLGHFVYAENKLDINGEVLDGVSLQKLLATMAHNGTEAVVMESTHSGASLSISNEIDYDIAVFTNLRYDKEEFNGMEEEYLSSKTGVFAKMIDPERHRKVVNIDDPNAPHFVAQGNSKVPVVTYAMENKEADVHALRYELSLFETEVLVHTPHGILEISSGLLGRDNIYNILAAVAVGIAVGAPLEDIVRGIEEVDAVPGRFELIDEEQAFGVIVDHAKTPGSLSRLLESVRELGPRRIITVFGCCGEGERLKRPLMTKIAAERSDVVMLTSDNPKTEDPLDILDDMLSGVGWSMQDYLKYGENDYYPPLPNGHRLFLHDIRRVAVRAAVAMGEEGDAVVIAGKGHDTYQIEGDKREFFDDREECREALHYVDELHQAGIDTSEFPWRLPESH